MNKLSPRKLADLQFHPDIKDFLYFADSPLKNYEYNDICKQLNIYIFSGNARSGMNIYSNEEPSAIYTSFKVIKNHVIAIKSHVPYYPRYRALNPYQRYEYLEFLCNPYQKANIGYVYLLYYGLERRLSEGKEEVIPIMLKLADAHGEKFKKNVLEMLRKYSLWKAGKEYPMNNRVFMNYTLYIGCHDNKLD